MCIIKLKDLENLKHKIFYLEEGWTKKCNKVMYVIYSNGNFTEQQIKLRKKQNLVHVFADQLEMFKSLQSNFDDVDWFLYTPESRCVN